MSWEDETEVRKEAAWALGKINYSPALEPLIMALKDPDSDVRENAESAIEKLKKIDVAFLYARLKESDPRMRRILIRILANSQDKDFFLGKS